MASKPNRFLVGLFVLSGLVLGIGAAIWLGASKYFQTTNLYVTYFDESVSGLDRDAPVKYRGVTIGRVDRIGVAPDGKLVEVVLSIRPVVKITPQVTARLKEAGITGIKFIELDQKRAGPETTLLAPQYEVPYPVIPSEPSELKQILDNLTAVLDHIMKLDLQGISDSIITTLNSVNELLGSEKWKSILAQIDSVTAALERATLEMERVVSNPGVEKTVREVAGLLEEGRLLVAEARRQVQALQLPARLGKTMDSVEGVSRKAEDLISALDRQTQELTRNLSGLIVNLDQQASGLYRELARTSYALQETAENLRILSENLRDSPSMLIFNRNPQPRRWEESSP